VVEMRMAMKMMAMVRIEVSKFSPLPKEMRWDTESTINLRPRRACLILSSRQRTANTPVAKTGQDRKGQHTYCTVLFHDPATFAVVNGRNGARKGEKENSGHRVSSHHIEMLSNIESGRD
jgi:hypothetical protein